MIGVAHPMGALDGDPLGPGQSVRNKAVQQSGTRRPYNAGPGLGLNGFGRKVITQDLQYLTSCWGPF
jgi:hypothetical protein